MSSDSLERTSSVGLAACSRCSLTMSCSSLASRSPDSSQSMVSSNTYRRQDIHKAMAKQTYNKNVLDCLKKRLEGIEGKWEDELHGVLQVCHTTKRRSTNEPPFSLAYGTKGIIPLHIIVTSINIEVGNINQNSKHMKLNLNLLEEERENDIVRVAAYSQQLKSYYNKKAKVRQFQQETLCLEKHS